MFYNTEKWCKFVIIENHYMAERTYELELIDHLDFFGPNDSNLILLKKLFPKIRLIARGDQLKVIGNDDDVDDFELKFTAILKHYEIFGRIRESDIIAMMENGNVQPEQIASQPADVILYGRSGNVIRAKSPNQRRMVECIETSDILFAIGPAGTGKTYTAVALAVRALKNKSVKRIILTRPAVEAGENLGFLPGDLKDKLDPYMQPLYDALRDMLPPAKLLTYIEEGTIEIAPLAFMRGRTLDNAFVILDEAQNATVQQMKMFLTRMGKNAKFIVTGDVTQIDLPPKQPSGLIHAANILQNIEGIGLIYLEECDVVRHKLVIKILRAYQNKNE
jgi:phosphate starvation-inducible protein PhoH and related proteins